MEEALLRIIPADLPESRQSVIQMLSELSAIKQHELETGAPGGKLSSFTYSLEE